MRRMFRLHAIGLLILTLAHGPALAQGPPPPLTPLPPPPQPAGNPVTTLKAALGKALFWDEQLSSTRTVACGSCHQSAAGGSDPRAKAQSAHAVNPGKDGIPGSADDVFGSPGVVQNDASGAMVWSPAFGFGVQSTPRHAPSMIDAAYAPLLFWDGRASGTFADPITGTTVLPSDAALESQAAGPPASSVEMGHVARDWNDVTNRVQVSTPLALAMVVPAALTSYIAGRGYPALFEEAFGSPGVTASRILMAIASYERTLFSTQTPFDSLIAGTAQLRPDEQQGFQLFGQLSCANCHAGALMSDNAYHYIGVRPAAEDSGRAIVTHSPADFGSFRTPSLRNVAERGVFMHNGRITSLADVIDFYNRGGDFTAPNKNPLIVPLGLNATQKAHLLAFLGRPLTDPRVAGSLPPFDRPTLFSEGGFVPQVLTGGVPGGSGAPPQPVALEPALGGNTRFTLGVFAAQGGANAVLVVDDAVPPTGSGIPATGSFARSALTLAGTGASGGHGSVTLAIPDDPALYGHTLYARWYVEDPAAAGGVAASAPVRFQVFGAHGAGLNTTTVSPVAASGGVRLYGSQPNPFRTTALVRFDLPLPARVDLTVYDVSGRAQRHLYANAAAVPGAYAIPWDGRDDAGRAVSAGMYFYRLDTDRGSRTARAVRIP